jgi:HSP20 family molecular chaperone IbpA
MNERATPTERLRASDREFDNMRELLEALMTGLSPAQQRIRMRPDLGWAPPTDVYETETDFVVTMDIAGIVSKDINVYTDGKILTIRADADRCEEHFYELCERYARGAVEEGLRAETAHRSRIAAASREQFHQSMRPDDSTE